MSRSVQIVAALVLAFGLVIGGAGTAFAEGPDDAADVEFLPMEQPLQLRHVYISMPPQLKFVPIPLPVLEFLPMNLSPSSGSQ